MTREYTELTGDHKAVTQTAVALAEAGRTVTVRRGNSTTELPADIGSIQHNDGRSYVFVNGVVRATVREDSTVMVSEVIDQ